VLGIGGGEPNACKMGDPVSDAPGGGGGGRYFVGNGRIYVGSDDDFCLRDLRT
jgi:hypothetical protein